MMEALMREGLPVCSTFFGIEDNKVRWAPQAGIQCVSKANAVALMALMCLMPFLFLFKSLRNRRWEMWHNVHDRKTIREEPVEVVAERLYREHLGATKPDARLPINLYVPNSGGAQGSGSAFFVHHAIGKDCRALQKGETTVKTKLKKPEEVRALLHFAYLGMEKALAGLDLKGQAKRAVMILHAGQKLGHEAGFLAAIEALHALEPKLTGDLRDAISDNLGVYYSHSDHYLPEHQGRFKDLVDKFGVLED